MSTTSNIQFISAGQDATQKTVAKAVESEFSFWDVLDVINPLQHIPILSTLYRESTGDTISAAANIAGGTLFGGPIGGGVAAASEIAQDAFGEKETETAFAENSEAPESQDSLFQQAANSYKHIRVTTAEWLDPNFESKWQLA